MRRRFWPLLVLVSPIAALGLVVAIRHGSPPADSAEAATATPGRADDRKPPNLLLVTIDTLRVDRVGSYGDGRDNTPTIDRLARRGARFTNAYATAPWTVPSMVSLLSGLQPAKHGVTEGVVEQDKIQGQQVIPGDIPLLAERLRERGYRTFGIAANAHLHQDFGFARGFDRFRCVGFERAERVLKVLGRWQDEILAARPYFLWLHFFDPHDPYRPNEDWLQRHWAARHRFVDLERVHPASLYEGMFVRGERLEYVKALYDGAVRHADDALGQALAMLGAERNAMIFLTADHGEEFADHGAFGHAHSLFEELVRVPFVVVFPDERFPAQVRDEPVSLVDVLPTLAEITGFRVPEEMHGRSLLPTLRGERSEPRAILAEVGRDKHLAMSREGRFKLIRPLGAPEQSLIFDLESDPGERVNLYDADPARAQQMQATLLGRLGAWARTTPVPATPLDPKTIETLRSLGYVE